MRLVALTAAGKLAAACGSNCHEAAAPRKAAETPPERENFTEIQICGEKIAQIVGG